MEGYPYTRTDNSNLDHFARKVALLEALNLLSERGQSQHDDIAAGKVFAPGMTAFSSAILARVKAGDVIVAQEYLYSNAYNSLNNIALRMRIEVVGQACGEWAFYCIPHRWVFPGV